MTDTQVTLRPERWAAGGDAIARADDGRVVFVRGAVPGDEVLVRLHSVKRDFAKADVVEVLTPSPDRVAAPCPEVANGCGGCGWQHLAPEAQRTAKAAIVADALRRTGKLPDATVRVGGTVPSWGYRTTMRLAAAPDGALGLRAERSNRVVPLAQCPVAHPSLSTLLAGVRLRGADELSLRVSVATGEATALPSDPRGKVSGLPAHVGIGPDAVVHESVAGVSLRVSAASFFQSGPAAADLLVDTVRVACGDLLADDSQVLDAYGGIGLFAAALPMRNALVVESSRSACADARVNVPAATVRQSPFEHWSPQPVRLAVVDPARAGLGAEAAGVLARTDAERIVLVSCDPVSLARDAALLGGHGYRHIDSTVLDLFPHTPHVEVVTVFDRG
jgi:23S rRNA (uracil1939-C5)-methyltransferase